MRVDDIRQLGTPDLRTRIDEQREELRNLRFQRAIGQLTDAMRLRAVKRDIARLETILRERELAAALESTEEK
ncbi:MAG: 50S ribosomal protein L29 [Candidatus Aminicenantales bacterium]